MWNSLRHLLFGKPDLVVREEVALDERRAPKTSELTKPLEYYIALYERSWAVLDELPKDVRPGHPDFKWYTRQVTNAYQNRVVATWGMIARGAAAVPYAATMLKSREADIREDATGIFEALARQSELASQIVDDLLAALKRETESLPRDGIILALGAMKDKRAIPALAETIRNPEADSDTRWTAVESLGHIVRRNFMKEAAPIEAAQPWLADHGY